MEPPKYGKLSLIRRIPLILCLATIGCDEPEQEAAIKTATDSPNPQEAAAETEEVQEDLIILDERREKALSELGFRLTGPEVLRGEDVAKGDFLETVLIESQFSVDQRFCTGVLIAPSVVATADHCVVEGVVRKGSKVRILNHKTEAALFQTEVVEDPRSSVIQFTTPKKVGADVRVRTDLALLKLKVAAPDTIRPVPLASPGDIQASNFARIVGYGVSEELGADGEPTFDTATGEFKFTSGRKKFADLSVVSTNCTNSMPINGVDLPMSTAVDCSKNQEIVAGYAGGVNTVCSIKKLVEDCRKTAPTPEQAAKCTPEFAAEMAGANSERARIICADTCSGDSGGPIFVAPENLAGSNYPNFASTEVWKGLRDNEGRQTAPPTYRLAGITSRSVGGRIQGHTTVAGRKCGSGGIYTLVATGESRNWIANVLTEWQVN